MKTIFDRVKIKNLTAKNRAVRSATNERGFCSQTGEMTEELLKVYEELILGDVGIIITSFANVLEWDQPAQYMLGIYHDKFIDGFRPLTELARAHDCKIILQIVHGGSQSLHDVENRTILGASSVENLYSKVTPKEATGEELAEIVTAFGDAALRAKKAGFHGVQIHGAHGYFLSQFLNPYYNRREDQYGGTVENRSRLIFEVYQEIRKRVGEDFIVSIKINCEDFMERGATLEDTLCLCRKLSQMGIDLIEVSGGSASSDPGKGAIRPMKSEEDQSYFYLQGKKIAEEVQAPVALVGGHKSFGRIQEILNDSKIEFISLSRPLVSEPDLIQRWKEDRAPARCISCNRCFLNGKRCVLI